MLSDSQTQVEQIETLALPAEPSLPMPFHVPSLPIKTGLGAQALLGSTEAWLSVTVKKGDTLSVLFKRLGISQTDLQIILRHSAAKKWLRKIHPGQDLHFLLSAENHLQRLLVPLSAVESVDIQRSKQGFAVQLHQPPISTRTVVGGAKIRSTFFGATQTARIPPKIANQLIQLFSKKVNFVRHVRPGDEFRVLFRGHFQSGRLVDNGQIIAAELKTRAKTYQIFSYTDSKGHSDFYSNDGQSLRSSPHTFMRAPLRYKYISSHFSGRRWQPILKRYRPHRGIDYAAHPGSPVWAAGDGRITFVGRHGGYGNVVKISHGFKYSTIYAHLSRFAPRLRRGTPVKQGQVIGYVGRTGLATGPNLHFEVRVFGIAMNPQRVVIPAAAPISWRYRRQFAVQSKRLIAQLHSAKLA